MMEKTFFNEEEYGGYSFEELRERYKKLYVPAVSDVLDDLGCWDHTLPIDIVPLDLGMKVAGPAFTVAGRCDPDISRENNVDIIDILPEHSVSIWDTGGDMFTGHWGELMTNSALYRNSQGAVIDGGLRDTSFILKLGFPIFYKYRCVNDAYGRWKIIEYNCQIKIGTVKINPGDYVFGDLDGVVIIPKKLTSEVLLKAEELAKKEDQIRKGLREGGKLYDLYSQTKHRK